MVAHRLVTIREAAELLKVNHCALTSRIAYHQCKPCGRVVYKNSLGRWTSARQYWLADLEKVTASDGRRKPPPPGQECRACGVRKIRSSQRGLCYACNEDQTIHEDLHQHWIPPTPDDLVTIRQAAALLGKEYASFMTLIRRRFIPSHGSRSFHNANGQRYHARLFRWGDILAMRSAPPRKPVPRKEYSLAELDALVAERLANAPAWFKREQKNQQRENRVPYTIPVERTRYRRNGLRVNA